MCKDGPKLVYLVTEDWYFLSHRLPMARAARDAGFEVHVATRVRAHGPSIEREGFKLHALRWERGNFDPLHLASVLAQVRKLYRVLQPALAHHVALVPALIGSLAATGFSFPYVNALAGLGFAFTSGSAKAQLMRPVLARLLRFVLNGRRATVLVQNPDDRAALQKLGVGPGKIVVIAGSGVDTVRLQPLPEPPPPITVGFVGRLLHDKGLGTLVEAQKLLRQRGINVDLLIAGETDPANPASIPASLLDDWKKREGIVFVGHVGDIRDVWRRAHIAALPSLREGLPLTLLEAAACGRPLIAADVPGCREIARQGLNALLVPAGAPAALSDAIAQLAADEGQRRRFGEMGRRYAESEFSSSRIGVEVVALYRKILASPAV